MGAHLLTAFQAIMAERSVTHAATRLNISQPAASAALSRLRIFFDDELLIASGRLMMPTAKAEALLPFVDEVLGNAGRLVAASTRFDPSTSERKFRIAGSDYILNVLLAPLLVRLQAEAPGIGFKLTFPGPAMFTELERGEIDLLLVPEQFSSATHPHVRLFEEPHVLVGWSGNPVLEQPLDLEQFTREPHVAVELGGPRAIPFSEQQMQRLGIERRVEIIAPSFAAVPPLLPRTNRLAVLHKRLADVFARHLPLKIVPLPFDMPLMHEVAQYRRARDTDEAMHWLLSEMEREARGVEAT